MIIAAFAIGEPTKFSGLNIVQYDAASLGAVLGARFRLLETISDAHPTPRGDAQLFGYHRFARQPA